MFPVIGSLTLSVFKLAQDYFSRGLKFARFKFAHPKQTYWRGIKFAHLSWIETTKIDQKRWIEAIFPQVTVIILYNISSTNYTKNVYMDRIVLDAALNISL